MPSDLRDPSTQLSQQEIEAIEITQGIIKRMAENSSKTKTVFIAITAAMGAFLKLEPARETLFTLIVYTAIVIVLWRADSTYLQLERKFRCHHKAIVDGAIPSLECWRLDISKYQSESVGRIMFCNFTTRIYLIAFIAAIIGIVACCIGMLV